MHARFENGVPFWMRTNFELTSNFEPTFLERIDRARGDQNEVAMCTFAPRGSVDAARSAHQDVRS
jgi:hypothetical protein